MRSHKDPKLSARILGMAQDGMFAEDIAKLLVEEEQERQLEKKEGSLYTEKELDEQEKELFPNEIKLIAQALAFRYCSREDAEEICRVLKKAYSCEIVHYNSSAAIGATSEAFRRDKEAVALSAITALFDVGDGTEYKWLCVEAPSGMGVLDDGSMLGVCCFSTSGVSRKNGQPEGQLGSLRLMGVLPRFQGLYVGNRLLRRAESDMFSKFSCVRSMVSVASTRTSLQQWVRRRGYLHGGDTGYPAKYLNHDVIDDMDVYLMVHLKALSADLFQTSMQADGKDKRPDVSIVINKVNGIESSAADAAEVEIAASADDDWGDATDFAILPQLGYVEAPAGQRGVALPPAWRFVSSSATTGAEVVVVPEVD